MTPSGKIQKYKLRESFSGSSAGLAGGGDLAAELAAGGLVEAVHGEPVPDPRAVGVRLGHDVVDVVQAPRGGLVLQPLQDEGADARGRAGRARRRR